MTERFWTVSELCEKYALKQGFVRKLCSEGRIPFFKIGRCVRFDPAQTQIRG